MSRSEKLVRWVDFEHTLVGWVSCICMVSVGSWPCHLIPYPSASCIPKRMYRLDMANTVHPMGEKTRNHGHCSSLSRFVWHINAHQQSGELVCSLYNIHARATVPQTLCPWRACPTSDYRQSHHPFCLQAGLSEIISFSPRKQSRN